MARERVYKPSINSKKYQVSQDEIDKVREDSRNAKELLENDYLQSYCTQAKKDILELHAKQAVYDVTVTTEANGEKKSISIPSEKEYTMLAGEYRFIERLLGSLEQTVLICKEMEEKIKSEEIEIIPED